MKGELVGKVLPRPLHDYFSEGTLKEFGYTTNDKSDQLTAVTLKFTHLTLQILLDCDDEKHSMTFVVR